MKYKTLLHVLRFLIYFKRFLWWLGRHFALILKSIFLRLWRFKGYAAYRIGYRCKKLGLVVGREWYTKRWVVHSVVLAILGLVGWPHSRFVSPGGFGVPGQHTKLYPLVADASDVDVYEEVMASPSFILHDSGSWWEQGAFGSKVTVPDTERAPVAYDVLADTLSGLAILKPITQPGAIVSGRTTPSTYSIEPGDSLYSIAADFGVSIATIMWANNLTPTSVLRPGTQLVIPPVTGVMHVVKRGETVGRIAGLYQADTAEIIAFNRLGQAGEGLRAGETIMVPNGVKNTTVIRTPVARPATGSRTENVRRPAAPPPSREMAGTSGFVWPSGARIVTQGFGISHHALDIAGPFHTPNYAANAGRVITADCPPRGEYRGKKLNHGYGCWVVIDHGNDVKTLYGHNDQILVGVGDYVERGQTIGLMGNTGNVRGVTGIHLHFEVVVKGRRVNPYGYIR